MKIKKISVYLISLIILEKDEKMHENLISNEKFTINDEIPVASILAD